MSKKLLIIGAGGVGREIAAVLKKHPLIDYRLSGFVDDTYATGTIINGLEVLGNIEWMLNVADDFGLIIAVGNPKVRKKIVDSLELFHFDYPILMHPNVSIHDVGNVSVGRGSYIGEGCILTTDIVIGEFCYINTACTLQHDTHIGSYSVLMPGVRITGGATIGEATYISTNCCIASNCRIDANSVIKESIL